jgi:hypothetical protein
MRRPVSRNLLALAALGLTLAPAAAFAAPCPPSLIAQPKGNQLFLYFPTSVDSTFPLYGGTFVSGATSPLAAFNVADLDPGIGTTSQLRNGVFNMVVDDYCEFNVEVNSSTTLPTPTMPRWQIVGLGTDSADVGGILFGIAQAVDTNDSDPQDYSRVFAKSFKDAYAGAGNVLNGVNSTLQRWTYAIGETAAHEAAHNYGAAHGHSAPRPASAEDGQNWHIMATGSTGLTGLMRVTRNRHFSDTEYEILGYNVGLNIKTLHNWDFVNPNGVSADSMRIKVLSTSNSLSTNWWYNGSASPWDNPTVSYTGTTQNFQGSTYFVHNVDFTVPQSWNGPNPGVVMPAADFHTGVTFSGSATTIIFDVQLFSGSTLLPLAPRLAGYDTGDVELGGGGFGVNFFNTNVAAGPLQLSEVLVFRSPRMVDISSMMRNARPVDLRGEPVEFLSSARFTNLELTESLELPIAKLTDKRSVDIVYSAKDCPPGSLGSVQKDGVVKGGAGDGEGVEIQYCHKGNALSLFPATYTYMVAKVVDPNALHWDAKLGELVTGPLETVIYYQLGGFVPDFNRNGTDDLIDIRTGTSRDEDGNGVPDEVRTEGGR